MSFEFLAPDAAAQGDGFTPLACSPMAREARAAGARFEPRDGWNVAVGYTSVEQERETCRRTAGWADVSHLGKLEIQAGADDLRAIVAQAADGAALELGTATRAGDAWWCPLTRERAVVLCAPAATAALRERLEEAATAVDGFAGVVEITTKYGALTLLGPLAREVFARFSAIDLRPKVAPVGALRPGSIARGPGMLVVEGEDRFLFTFGWALGQYMWTTVADAAEHLGGAPVGLDALEAVAIGVGAGGVAVEGAGRA